MPIVINEIVIKATVTDLTRAEPAPAAATAGAGMDDETLVAACVEEVLRVLDRRKER
jgi:hypothetical protein